MCRSLLLRDVDDATLSLPSPELETYVQVPFLLLPIEKVMQWLHKAIAILYIALKFVKQTIGSTLELPPSY